MFLLGFPLLIVPLALYNIMTFLIPVDWQAPLTTIPMMSGGQWTISFADILLAIAIVMLMFETVKATRTSSRSIVDHMLSTLVFVAALVEFLLVPRVATSTFALLVLICLIDVVGGYTVSIRTARRDYSIERGDTL
ncbi:MAG: hypothetical protein AB7K64_02690 [Variibacter sp.]